MTLGLHSAVLILAPIVIGTLSCAMLLRQSGASWWPLSPVPEVAVLTMFTRRQGSWETPGPSRSSRKPHSYSRTLLPRTVLSQAWGVAAAPAVKPPFEFSFRGCVFTREFSKLADFSGHLYFDFLPRPVSTLTVCRSQSHCVPAVLASLFVLSWVPQQPPP